MTRVSLTDDVDDAEISSIDAWLCKLIPLPDYKCVCNMFIPLEWSGSSLPGGNVQCAIYQGGEQKVYPEDNTKSFD